MNMNQISSAGGCIQTPYFLSQDREMLYKSWDGQQLIKPYANYPCSYCGRIFDRKHSVKQHILSIHEGVRYTCQYCEKSYGGPGSLYNHVKKSHPQTNSSEEKQDQS